MGSAVLPSPSPLLKPAGKTPVDVCSERAGGAGGVEGSFWILFFFFCEVRNEICLFSDGRAQGEESGGADILGRGRGSAATSQFI